MAGDTLLDSVRTDFIEQTGMISQAEGMPRIAGRILGLLIYDGDIISFGDLATKLQVSRASISTSMRILEERGLAKRVTKPGERQSYFQLAPNPYATMLEGIQKRNNSIQADIAKTIAALPEGSDALDRISEHADFYAAIGMAIRVALSEFYTRKQPSLGQQTTAPKDQVDDK